MHKRDEITQGSKLLTKKNCQTLFKAIFIARMTSRPVLANFNDKSVNDQMLL